MVKARLSLQAFLLDPQLVGHCVEEDKDKADHRPTRRIRHEQHQRFSCRPGAPYRQGSTPTRGMNGDEHLHRQPKRKKCRRPLPLPAGKAISGGGGCSGGSFVWGVSASSLPMG